jgi:hypothetical protein
MQARSRQVFPQSYPQKLCASGMMFKIKNLRGFVEAIAQECVGVRFG